MSYYEKHIFFCTNLRPNGNACCANFNAENMVQHAKQRIKDAGISGVRVNKAGCLGLCESGPVLVIYPESTWYCYVDQTDIDEIIDKHVIEGVEVPQLKI